MDPGLEKRLHPSEAKICALPRPLASIEDRFDDFHPPVSAAKRNGLWAEITNTLSLRSEAKICAPHRTSASLQIEACEILTDDRSALRLLNCWIGLDSWPSPNLVSPNRTRLPSPAGYRSATAWRTGGHANTKYALELGSNLKNMLRRKGTRTGPPPPGVPRERLPRRCRIR